MSNLNPDVGGSTATNPHSKIIGKPVIGLSPEAFKSRLDYLMKSGAFDNDSPLIAKGRRQHVKRLLEFWEHNRQSLILYKSPTSIQFLKGALKSGRGQYNMPKMHNSELSKFPRFVSTPQHLEIRDEYGCFMAYRFLFITIFNLNTNSFIGLEFLKH